MAKSQNKLNKTLRNDDTNHLSRESCIFPQSTSFDLKITSFKLTNDFLIYSTNHGEIFHFNISNWNYANNYQHNCSILHIFPNAIGTRVAFVDEKGLAFIYNPANGQLIEIPEFCPSINNILWDLEDTENPLLIAYDNLRINVYRYFMNECILNNLSVVASSRKVDDMLKMPTKQITDEIQNDSILITNRNKNINNDASRSNSVTSTKFSNDKADYNKLATGAIFGNCHFIGVTRLPNNHLPLCSINGELCMLSPTGRLLTQLLTTHQFRLYTKRKGLNIDEKHFEFTGIKKLSYHDMVTYFEQALKSGCFEDAEYLLII
ncbi:unnamed protein product [Schistosoma mattheei]|uniref:WDR19 WD40 repeat domain-containing protein n=1 Tax=Schistosoma mattheei TaxID=31246 RepID=A0AA85BTJ3_9TREM|nr:unnamed protein product [Schistosoma mattheei]